jgi:hypothetical protein
MSMLTVRRRHMHTNRHRPVCKQRGRQQAVPSLAGRAKVPSDAPSPDGAVAMSQDALHGL